MHYAQQLDDEQSLLDEDQFAWLINL